MNVSGKIRQRLDVLYQSFTATLPTLVPSPGSHDRDIRQGARNLWEGCVH